MDRTRTHGRVAEMGGSAGRIHPFRFFAQQRLHLAAFLIAFAIAPLLHAGDVDFKPDITKDEFRKFSLIVGQSIFATPVEPARATGIVRFDIGVAATAVKIDTGSPYWTNSVSNDFSSNGYVGTPRVIVAKGFGSGTISASYAKVNGSNAKMYGGALDTPIINGGLVRPTLALRLSYARLTGIDVFKEKVYGAEVFLSKGFGPVTPYIAAGKMRTDATGTISSTITMKDTSTINRYTVGARLSLFVPKIIVEVTQAEVRSYAAKVSIGF
jgi:hypothetical protein